MIGFVIGVLIASSIALLLWRSVKPETMQKEAKSRKRQSCRHCWRVVHFYGDAKLSGTDEYCDRCESWRTTINHKQKTYRFDSTREGSKKYRELASQRSL